MSIPHRVRTEAYAGAASITLAMPRAYAEVLNDLDSEIVNLFRVLRDRRMAEELIRLLRLTPYARIEFEATYDGRRGNRIERARRFMVRSWMGYSSRAATSPHRTGFRANCTRSGTHPAGDYSRLPDALPAIVERLQGVLIESRPAIEVIQRYDGADALHFVDPPYQQMLRRGARRGYRHEMGDNDHRELAKVLHGCKGAWVICGYPGELYDVELFPNAYRQEFAAFAEGAAPRTEVLWSNRPIVEQGTLW